MLLAVSPPSEMAGSKARLMENIMSSKTRQLVARMIYERDAITSASSLQAARQLLQEMRPSQGWSLAEELYQAALAELATGGLAVYSPVLTDAMEVHNAMLWAHAVPNGQCPPWEEHGEALSKVIDHLPAIEAALAKADGQEEDQPSKSYAEVLEFAEELPGKQRRVLELLCSHGGQLPLADLANSPGIGWEDPVDDAWNSVMRKLNAKLKEAKLPYTLGRKNNAAILYPSAK